MDIISISWGLDEDVPAIAKAIDKAYNKGIIILASASNNGANKSIAFPARLKNVFCIGAADGKGSASVFNPPYLGVEKYSALGEAVSGADVLESCMTGRLDPERPSHSTITRRSGTSTATPIAAGIVAIFLDFICQFIDPAKALENTGRIRKLFLEMSKATVNLTYRYLAPWSLFKQNSSRKEFQDIFQNPTGIHRVGNSD